jgi:hypothetical protein
VLKSVLLVEVSGVSAGGTACDLWVSNEHWPSHRGLGGDGNIYMAANRFGVKVFEDRFRHQPQCSGVLVTGP